MVFSKVGGYDFQMLFTTIFFKKISRFVNPNLRERGLFDAVPRTRLQSLHRHYPYDRPQCSCWNINAFVLEAVYATGLLCVDTQESSRLLPGRHGILDIDSGTAGHPTRKEIETSLLRRNIDLD